MSVLVDISVTGFASTVCNELSNYRLSMDTEIHMQDDIESILNTSNISFEREYRLGSHGVIDFFVPSRGLGIEIKLKAVRADIVRQLDRYAESDQLNALLLVTMTSLALPKALREKPVYCYRAGLAQL